VLAITHFGSILSNGVGAVLQWGPKARGDGGRKITTKHRQAPRSNVRDCLEQKRDEDIIPQSGNSVEPLWHRLFTRKEGVNQFLEHKTESTNKGEWTRAGFFCLIGDSVLSPGRRREEIKIMGEKHEA